MIDGSVTGWVDEGREFDWLKKCATLSFPLMAIEVDGEVALVVFGGSVSCDFSRNRSSLVASHPHISRKTADVQKRLCSWVRSCLCSLHSFIASYTAIPLLPAAHRHPGSSSHYRECQ
jgi:hypothetical protein